MSNKQKLGMALSLVFSLSLTADLAVAQTSGGGPRRLAVSWDDPVSGAGSVQARGCHGQAQRRHGGCVGEACTIRVTVRFRCAGNMAPNAVTPKTPAAEMSCGTLPPRTAAGDGELDGDGGAECQDQGNHSPRRYRGCDRDVAEIVDTIPVGIASACGPDAAESAAQRTAKGPVSYRTTSVG